VLPFFNPHRALDWFMLKWAGFQVKTYRAPQKPNLNLMDFSSKSTLKNYDNEIFTALKMTSIPFFTGLGWPQFGV
jgi:hypothetical protein